MHNFIFSNPHVSSIFDYYIDNGTFDKQQIDKINDGDLTTKITIITKEFKKLSLKNLRSIQSYLCLVIDFGHRKDKKLATLLLHTVIPIIIMKKDI